MSRFLWPVALGAPLAGPTATALALNEAIDRGSGPDRTSLPAAADDASLHFSRKTLGENGDAWTIVQPSTGLVFGPWGAHSADRTLARRTAHNRHEEARGCVPKSSSNRSRNGSVSHNHHRIYLSDEQAAIENGRRPESMARPRPVDDD